MGRDGDCFRVAVELTFDRVFDVGFMDGGEIHIVHGLPVGRGDENESKRFWHAWVEVTKRTPVPEGVGEEFRSVWGDEIVTVLVVDRSNGLDVELPREFYYGFGRLDEEHVWRFTPEQAGDEMRAREHYGPWVDGWEGMHEVG